MKILLIAATEAEITPFIKHIEACWEHKNNRFLYKDDIELEYVITGVGMLVTTYALTKKLQNRQYDLVLQVGIAGSYDRSLKLGDVVWVKSEQLADLRVEDHDEYIDVFELGLIEKDAYPFTGSKLLNKDDYERIHVEEIIGVDAITVNTVTGKGSSIKHMCKKYQCEIESMEGAALHYVCLMEGVAFLQLRGISNYVEPRNKDAWDIETAILRVNNYLVKYLENV